MELSVKELRIGNFITLLGWDEDAGGNIISDASGDETVIVDIDVLRNIIKDDNLTQYDPIPLTEEWLLKFGFEWTKSDFPELKKGALYFVSVGNGVLMCFYNTLKLENIKQVHQLQNLYFALTNEELILTK